jgi:DNA-binding response OmpR family regulator
VAIEARADVPLGLVVNATARKPREAPRQRLSILVADDDRDTVDTLAALLSDEGHTVHTVTNGSLVENAVRVFKPQVCILDIEMPGKNGYALVQDILAREPAPRPLMIAISGIWKAQTDRMLARMVGFDHFFEKPADPAALIDVIEDYAAPPDQAA